MGACGSGRHHSARHVVSAGFDSKISICRKFRLDFFLFYVFWELTLVPMYFLIGIWGSERRLYAAIKFFLYTLAGSVLMLLAILTLYYRAHEATGQPYTFDVPTLLA